MALIETRATAFDVVAHAPETTPAPAVLLVEDEAFLRLTTADELRDSGFRVIEATNADEAIKILRSKVRVDIVLSDIRMPGERDGVALAHWTKMHYPDLAVILVSGDVPPATAAGVIEAFFPKPYVVSDVAERIASALANQRAS